MHKKGDKTLLMQYSVTMKALLLVIATALILGTGRRQEAEITRADLKSMTPQQKAVVSLCMADKYVAEHGERAWENWMVQYETPKALDAALMEEGYSCTRTEAKETFPDAFS